MSKTGLEKIESAVEDMDIPDKDFGFEDVNLRTDDVDFDDDESDSN